MEIKKLKNLFESSFEIPNYQRGYSWQKKQLDDFWTDINNINAVHYMGTIYTETITRRKITYEILIDGQQRLTTLAILIYELEKKKKQSDKIFKKIPLSYTTDNPNYEFLTNNIFAKKSNLEDVDLENIYQKNLLEAKKYFNEKLENLDDTELDNFLNNISKSLLFEIINVNKINNNINSQVIFEILNNRGKPLSILEKLKNRLMYLSMNLDNGSNLVSNINTKWTSIYNILGEIDTKDINSLEDELVSSHLTIYRNSENKTFSARGAEEKLFQMFCTDPTIYPLNEKSDWDKLSEYQKRDWEREPPINDKKIVNYINSLENFASQWKEIINRKNYAINKCLMQDSSKELKILLTTILMKYNGLNGGLRDELIKLIEKVLFRQNLPGEWQRTHSFSTLAYYFYNQDKMLDEKTIDFDGLKNQLLWGLLQEFSAESISQNFKSLYTFRIDNAGFYRWKGLKYFLYEYEESLRENNYWAEDYTKLEIEHILPKSFKDNGWKDVVGNVGKNSQNVIVNALGNLMLIDASKNSSIGNACWQEKKKKYKENPTKCEEFVAKKDQWNRACIIERNEMMYEFFCKKINWIFKDSKMLLKNCVEYFYGTKNDEGDDYIKEIDNSFKAFKNLKDDKYKMKILYYNNNGKNLF